MWKLLAVPMVPAGNPGPATRPKVQFATKSGPRWLNRLHPGPTWRDLAGTAMTAALPFHLVPLPVVFRRNGWERAFAARPNRKPRPRRRLRPGFRGERYWSGAMSAAGAGERGGRRCARRALVGAAG